MKEIRISDETYEKIKDQLLEDEGKNIESFSDMIGGKYFFRTVSYFVVGKVKKQIGQFFELENASWIPDTGRFMQFLKDGKLNEVEPTGTHFVNIEMVVDFFEWKHKLPKDQL
jgi:hypothetical protein